MWVSWGVISFILWDCLFAYLFVEENEIAVTCSGSIASLLPFPLPATVDMQPNPWGFSLAQGPTPKLICAGWAPEPLAWVSAQCWSLDENLSCSTQHNVTIIAPIQGNHTWLLVHPGPQKADRGLSGGYWGRRVSWLDEHLFFCCTFWFLFQGTRLLPAPRPPFGVSCHRAQSTVVSAGKGAFVLVPQCCTSPPLGSFRKRAPLAP